MKITSNLSRAIKSHIESNLGEYIQYGEFDPSLSAIKAVAHMINTYTGASSLYEAIGGDPTIANNLFAMVMERQYFDETELRLELRKRLISNASRALIPYECFAWELWERSICEPAGYDSAPDINVANPSLREIFGEFEQIFSEFNANTKPKKS